MDRLLGGSVLLRPIVLVFAALEHCVIGFLFEVCKFLDKNFELLG
jgi:hypothetical protein